MSHKHSKPNLKRKTLRVTWKDEAWAYLKALPTDTALAIMEDIGLGVQMLCNGVVSDKVRHMARTRSEDPRLRIECGHYRAIVLRKGDILTVLQILYRDEGTYGKVWQWQTAAHTHEPQQAS